MPATSLTKSAITKAVADSWEPGPLRPRLGEGAVHVWRADLAAVSDDLIEVLSAEERARAERFLRARNGVLWARAHGVLRVLLGRYLDADPGSFRFVAAESGKPALLDGAPPSPTNAIGAGARPTSLSFNLSHSRELALFAFSRDGPVGVDLEVARRPIDAVAIAARAFGVVEARRLERVDPAVREREFLRDWTRHEAMVKYDGAPSGGGESTEGVQPWTSELELSGRAAGAVVVVRPPVELRCWDWSG